MNTTNRTLTYTIIFIAAGILSFGITFGSLTLLAKEDSSPDREPEITQRDPEPTPEPEEPTPAAMAVQKLQMTKGFSIEANIPEDWMIEMYRPMATTVQPGEEEPDMRPAFDIKSPIQLDENGQPTGVQFCLSFGYGALNNKDEEITTATAMTSEPVSIFGTQSNLNTIQLADGTPMLSVIDTKTLPGGQLSYPLIGALSAVAITGVYNCRSEQPGPVNLSAEDFNNLPEVSIAKEIIKSATIVIEDQTEYDKMINGIFEFDSSNIETSSEILTLYNPLEGVELGFSLSTP